MSTDRLQEDIPEVSSPPIYASNDALFEAAERDAIGWRCLVAFGVYGDHARRQKRACRSNPKTAKRGRRSGGIGRMADLAKDACGRRGLWRSNEDDESFVKY